MSEFYGSVRGNRGVATRQGSKESGIQTSAQSWDGSVIVRMSEERSGRKWVSISVAQGSKSYPEYTVLTTPLEELMKAERLDIVEEG